MVREYLLVAVGYYVVSRLNIVRKWRLVTVHYCVINESGQRVAYYTSAFNNSFPVTWTSKSANQDLVDKRLLIEPGGSVPLSV